MGQDKAWIRGQHRREDWAYFIFGVFLQNFLVFFLARILFLLYLPFEG
jgi:hypothetical protein